MLRSAWAISSRNSEVASRRQEEEVGIRRRFRHVIRFESLRARRIPAASRPRLISPSAPRAHDPLRSLKAPLRVGAKECATARSASGGDGIQHPLWKYVHRSLSGLSTSRHLASHPRRKQRPPAPDGATYRMRQRREQARCAAAAGCAGVMVLAAGAGCGECRGCHVLVCGGGGRSRFHGVAEAQDTKHRKRGGYPG